MAARGLTRPITRKAARSYEMTTPNPMGVTAIASVNSRSGGKRTAAQKAATARMLAANLKRRRFESKLKRELARAKKNGKSSSYQRSYARTRRLLKGDTSMRTRRRRARRNMTASELNAAFEAQLAGSRSGGSSGAKKPRRRLTAKEKARRARAAAKRRQAGTRRIGRTYGRFKSLSARIGKSRAATYAYKGKRGTPKKIPLYAILGFKSRSALLKRAADDPRTARRVVAAKKRRDKAAARLLAHGDFFTPNRRKPSRRRTISYQTWSANTMRARRNYRKGKLRGAAKAKWKRAHPALVARWGKSKRGAAKRSTGGRRKRRSAAQRAATAKMLRARWGKSRVRRRKAWRNTKATPNGRRRRRARRNPVVTQAAANARRRRRRTRRNPVVTQAAANPRRRRRKSRRNPVLTQAAANPRRRRRRRSRKNAGMMYSSNPRRRRRRHARSNTHRRRRRSRKNAGMMYSSNPRRRHRRHRRHYTANRRGHRRYRRNPDLMVQLKALLKVGALVTVGIVLHRAGAYLLSEKLLTKVDLFSTGALADYRGLIGGAATAVVEVAAVARLAPSQLPTIGAGIMASLVHSAVVLLVKKFVSPDVAGYLAAYPDAEGVAFHQMAGYGSYEVVPGFSGFGEYDYYNQYAGMGAGPSSDLVTQAAAGMGEFFLPGVSGYGEYETVSGVNGMGASYVDEGIHPNLDAAERALTVAEAAAGIGDLPLTSTLNPYQVAAPVMDGPTGSRAGILQGSEGIFGRGG